MLALKWPINHILFLLKKTLNTKESYVVSILDRNLFDLNIRSIKNYYNFGEFGTVSFQSTVHVTPFSVTA